MPQIDLKRVEDALRTRYWHWELYAEDKQPNTLLDLLLAKLPHINASSWGERFEFGGIYVNGQAALCNIDLPRPVRVEYYEPKFSIAEAHKQFAEFREDYVIFHDDTIAVVYKPPNLPSMPAKEQRHFSLKQALEKLFETSIHMPSRLDISAQGLLVVSISPQANAPLQRAFETRTVRKTYRFATTSRSAWNERVIDFKIARAPEHAVLRCASRTHGQSAETIMKYSHSTSSNDLSVNIYSAHPITGRTHQIRVHAAACELSIAGDNFYAGALAEYLHLVSCELSLQHPIHNRKCSFTLPAALAPAWISKR